MSEPNKVLATRFLNALGVGDTETLGQVMHRDFQAIAKGHAAISGSRSYELVMKTSKAFTALTKSGLNPKILSMTAEEDRVAVEWQGDCTLVNGAEYNNHYAFIFYFRDGKILKIHEYFDTHLTDTVLLPLLTEMGLGA
jgi:ketosteroid isomerase-like protein